MSNYTPFFLLRDGDDDDNDDNPQMQEECDKCYKKRGKHQIDKPGKSYNGKFGSNCSCNWRGVGEDGESALWSRCKHSIHQADSSSFHVWPNIAAQFGSYLSLSDTCPLLKQSETTTTSLSHSPPLSSNHPIPFIISLKCFFAASPPASPTLNPCVNPG